ncbi:MAG: transglycosylase SLT domain-containing protein [Candidatus Hydrogenedentes bacterium]|nr:transglycosylase SLT domain-containing protein [Candidatus Hydrogenedentota bacterium]
MTSTWALLLLLGAQMLPGQGSYLAGSSAERIGRLDAAILAYSACAQEDPNLAPYATAQLGQCYERQGDFARAEAAYQRAITEFGGGPWVRMAKAMLASLYHDQNRNEALPGIYQDVLQVAPQPWWIDSIRWQAGERLVETGHAADFGHLQFRNIVEYVGLLQPRLDAARKLIHSNDSLDRALAILGMLRSNAYPEAAQEYLKQSFSVRAGDLELAPSALNERLFHALNGDEAALAPVWNENPYHPWLWVWMACTLRNSAVNEQWPAADYLMDRMIALDPQRRDTGDALWWYAKHVEATRDHAAAIPIYRRLGEACTTHYRADDALYRIAEIHLEAGNTAAGIEAYAQVGELLPGTRLAPQALFECARLQENLKQADAAIESYELAARIGFGNYYAHRALGRLQELSAQPAPPAMIKVDGVRPSMALIPTREPLRLTDTPNLEQRPEVARLRFFGAHGLDAGEWEALDWCLNADPDATSDYLRVAADAGFAHTALQFADAKKVGAANEAMPPMSRLQLEYPRAYWQQVKREADAVGLDPYLLLAVAKQESTFRPGLTSSAGAQGLMQIMPGTAKWLVKVEPDITEDNIGNLMSPENSLKVGAHYLSRMYDRSGGNLIDTLASYNGGPGNCDKWRKKFPDLGSDDFIEAIPFDETQNYVKRVLGYYAAYRSMYSAVGQ